ncbi:type I restriction enzyme specificity protein [Burkholderia pseudomallei]|nr:type I restriction enzyme specificity protein [Burkholderia pseudomallei]
MSLPRYPQYKDSGIKWLEDIPAHWTMTRLRYLGHCLDGQRVPLNSEQRADKQGNVPYWGANSIVDYIDDALFDEELILLGEDGAPFFDRTRPVAFVSYGKVWPNNHIHVIRPTKGISASFVASALNITDYAQFIDGSTRDKLTQGRMGDIPVPLPPVEEQSVIAAFLDRETRKIDALISEQEKLLALLAEKRQATVSHAVTRGLNPDAPMMDSGATWLEQVPAHWQVCPIKHVARIGNGSTPNRDNPDYWTEKGFPWLNSSVVNLDAVTQADQYVTELALAECHLPIVEPPAVLVGITGQGKTRGMASKLMFKATVNQHLAYIKTDDSKLTVPFLLRALEMAYDHLRTESEGAGSTKGAITCEQLGRLAIPLPDTKEQLSIAAFLDTETAKLDALKTEAERSIGLLKERRSALIAAAVTGKIDVRNAVPQELAA